MNAIMQQLINHKINSLTTSELLSLASENQIPVTTEQAQKVIAILKSETIDVGNQNQIHRILGRLQTEVDDHVSSVIQQLLQQFSHYLF